MANVVPFSIILSKTRFLTSCLFPLFGTEWVDSSHVCLVLRQIKYGEILDEQRGRHQTRHQGQTQSENVTQISCPQPIFPIARHLTPFPFSTPHRTIAALGKVGNNQLLHLRLLLFDRLVLPTTHTTLPLLLKHLQIAVRKFSRALCLKGKLR